MDVDFLLAWAIPMLSLLIAKPGASLHTLFRGGGGWRFCISTLQKGIALAKVRNVGNWPSVSVILKLFSR